MQIGPRIRFDSHTLGNLIKNVAPAAAFTPLGVLGAGGLGALGERLRGKTDLGSIAKAGLSNAAIGAGAHAGVGALRGALGSAGGEAAGEIGAGGLPAPSITPSGISGSAMAAPVPPGGLPPVGTIPPAPGTIGGLSVPAPVASAATTLTPPPSALSRFAHGALDFAKENPTAVSGVLQGAGGLATAGAENRLHNAEAANLEQRTGETQYDLDQRKRREAQLAPAWGALGTALGTGLNSPTANPYIPRVG